MADVYARAMELLNQQAWDAALPLLDEAIAVEPARARIHSNRGFTLHFLGRPAEAKAAINRGIELRGDDPYPLLIAARVVAAQASYADALPLAQQAWDERERLFTESVGEVAEYVAQGLNEAERWRESLPILEQALEIAPQRASLHGVYATTLAMGYRFAEAQRALAAGLALASDDDYLLHRARVIADGIARAAEMARNARASVTGAEKKNWEHWHHLGMALFMTGELVEASAAFERARALHPDKIYRAKSSTAMMSTWEVDCRLALLEQRSATPAPGPRARRTRTSTASSARAPRARPKRSARSPRRAQSSRK